MARIRNRKQGSSNNSSTLSLPTRPIEPSDSIYDYNHCFYGRKSIGKTTIASSFPKSLNFRFERGRRNVRIFQVPEDGSLLLWEPFREYLNMFCDSDYEFAVIDSVDVCYEKAFEYICAQRNVTHPNQINDYGETWNMIAAEFMSAFDQLQDAGKKFILLSHEKTRKWENPDGTEIERVDLTLAPSAAAVIKQRCEFIYYYGYSGNDRTITIRNDGNKVECAAGIDEFFLDPDGTPLKQFEIPNDPTQAFPTLLKAWNNELRDYNYTPPREPRTSRRKSKRAARTR